MSFDLHFLALEPGQSWSEAMDALEEHAAEDRPLDEATLERWAAIRAAVAADLPDAEVVEGEKHRELSDETTGLQLSVFPSEVALSVPY